MKSISRFFLPFIFLISISTVQSAVSIQTVGNLWQKVNTSAYPVLQNLYFLSTTEGWVVGEQGTILHTVDAGVHWNSISVSSSTILRAVYFSDTATGYAGGDGVILQTKDAGNTWSKITIDFDIYSLYFDPVLKNNGYAVGSKGRILFTSNSGTSWSLKTSGSYKYTRIAFNTQTIGWIAGSVLTTGSGSWTADINPDPYSGTSTLPYIRGSLTKTNNSGSSWSTNTSSYLISDIQFSNTTIGWVAESQLLGFQMTRIQDGYSCGIRGCNYWGHFDFSYNINHYVFRTVNGGVSYQPYLVFSETSASSIRSLSISFTNATVGYVAGVGTNKLFKTVDGGLTWFSLSIGINLIQIKKILFKSSLDGWMVGSRSDDALGLGVILVTHDGGQTWQKQSPEGFSAIASLKSISYGIDGIGWMSGSGTQPAQYKSLDNGFSWYLVSTVFNNGLEINALNQNTCYLLDGNLFKTKNGGYQWDTVSVGISDTYVYGIRFANSTTQFLFGNFNLPSFYAPQPSPCILKSYNNDTNWSTVYSPLYDLDGKVTDLQFVNETTGWASVYRYSQYDLITEFVLYTNDRGNSWTKQYLPLATTNFVNQDIYFTTVSTGWVCDALGRLFYTRDAGNNWNYWGQPTDKSLNKIYFISPDIGWIIGNQGTILQTKDGGNTWQYLDPITSSNLNYIAFSPNKTGYIVGDNGTLLRLGPDIVGPATVPLQVWELLN